MINQLPSPSPALPSLRGFRPSLPLLIPLSPPLQFPPSVRRSPSGRVRCGSLGYTPLAGHFRRGSMQRGSGVSPFTPPPSPCPSLSPYLPLHIPPFPSLPALDAPLPAALYAAPCVIRPSWPRKTRPYVAGCVGFVPRKISVFFRHW